MDTQEDDQTAGTDISSSTAVTSHPGVLRKCNSSVTAAPQASDSASTPRTQTTDNAGMDSVKHDMLLRVSKSDSQFKSQQRDEPDLSQEEKLALVRDLLQNKPSVFLFKYGKFLEKVDLGYFDSLKEDYVIDFHLKEIQCRLDSHRHLTRVKNRRYEAMQELEAQGSYFSEEELKLRDPLLYEQMVGQYLDETDVQLDIDKSDLRFSTILQRHMDICEARKTCDKQRDIEESQMEECESDDDSGSESEFESDNEREEGSSSQQPAVPKISDSEKQLLRSEFLRTMQLHFMEGEDNDFDYTKVDGNVAYDSLDIREHDEQEAYFDGEDS